MTNNRLIKTIRRIVPRTLREIRHNLKSRKLVGEYQRYESVGQVFDDVYAKGIWNQSQEHSSLSGKGSTGDWLHGTVNFTLANEQYLNSVVLEIGSGDFSYGSAICGHAKRYIATDISAEIIRINHQKFNFENVEFITLDAITDSLPKADFIIIRQVLQHLTNDQVHKIVSKALAQNPKEILIFEDIPLARDFVANVDMPCAGPFTRSLFRSGLDLTSQPFDFPFFKDPQEWVLYEDETPKSRLICFRLTSAS